MELSKTTHIGGMVGAIVVIIVGAMVEIAASGPTISDTSAQGSIFGFVLMLLGAIGFTAANLHWLYKLWAVLPQGYQKHPPMRAALFMLAPLWNLYWVFEAIHGWAKQYNRYRHREDGDLPAVSEDLAFTACVLLVGSGIPMINLIAAPVAAIVLLLFVAGSIDAATELARRQTDANLPPDPA